jgi:hypothetical protein
VSCLVCVCVLVPTQGLTEYIHATCNPCFPQAKEKMKTLHIYEKNVAKRKNFKTLLAEDDDDIDFYDKLRKRDADKILINRQARGN